MLQVRFAGTGLVVLPVQERGRGRAEQPLGRAAGRVPGRAGGRAARRREAAHHRPAAPRAAVPRAVRLRAPAVRRAEHDQRQPARATGGRRRRGQRHRRGAAGQPAGRGRREDHGHPVGHGAAHHRPRLRGTVRVLEQLPLTKAVSPTPCPQFFAISRPFRPLVFVFIFCLF